MNNVKPYSPTDVKKNASVHFPDEVFSAVNELLCKHFRNGYAVINQNDILSLIIEKYNQNHPNKQITRQDVFAAEWLNFEEIYRDVGWTVVYDKPGYDESYEPTFEFST